MEINQSMNGMENRNQAEQISPDANNLCTFQDSSELCVLKPETGCTTEAKPSIQGDNLWLRSEILGSFHEC